jgi:hypothetical protein
MQNEKSLAIASFVATADQVWTWAVCFKITLQPLKTDKLGCRYQGFKKLCLL